MYWKTKDAPPPRVGAKKYVMRFAWLPKKIEGGMMCWLGLYHEEWEYKEHMHTPIIGKKVFSPVKVFGWVHTANKIPTTY